MRARIDAMRPSRPGPTRTAPPRMPDQFWTRGRYRGYIAFGACGFFLLALGLLLLRAVWVLGSGDPAAWERLLAGYANPLYLVFHFVFTEFFLGHFLEITTFQTGTATIHASNDDSLLRQHLMPVIVCTSPSVSDTLRTRAGILIHE